MFQKIKTSVFNSTMHKNKCLFQQESDNMNSIIGLLIGCIALFVSMPATDLTNAVSVNVVAEPQQTEVQPDFLFLKVNHITLCDDQKTVIEKLGQPDSIKQDPDINGSEVYEYPGMNIGLYNGMLEYLAVAANSGTIQIDDTTIRMILGDLKKALGDPDFVASDGIVYQHNENVIKIFIDESTQEVTSIHYFPLSST
jgi:hypothetical protein